MSSTAKSSANFWSASIVPIMFTLAMVFLNIGTSPLYVFGEFIKEDKSWATPQTIIGFTSLVVWLFIIVVGTYTIRFMDADHHGDGGPHAMLRSLVKLTMPSGTRLTLIMLCIAGIALIMPDGVLTMLITVKSIFEATGGLGREIGTTNAISAPLIWMGDHTQLLTAIFVVILFGIQPFGLKVVGKLMAPAGVTWLINGFLGIRAIAKSPEILKALNPLEALGFLHHHTQVAFATTFSIAIFATLLAPFASAMLSATGSEAIMADMLEFGKARIRFCVALASFVLISVYLGCGARILASPDTLIKVDGAPNPYWSLATSQLELSILIVMAIFWSVCAGQSVIIACFTLAKGAITHKLLPKLSEKFLPGVGDHHSLYIPVINWTLMGLTLLANYIFPASGDVAGAYGANVSTAMLCTITIIAFGIAPYKWKWSKTRIIVNFAPFILMVIPIWLASMTKIASGWQFYAASGVIFIVMATIGKKSVQEYVRANGNVEDSIIPDLRLAHAGD